MKMKILEESTSWKPVSLEITFQSKSELAAWLLMNNDHTRQKDEVVSDELANNLDFAQYEPLEADFHKLCAGEVWQKLRDKLDE